MGNYAEIQRFGRWGSICRNCAIASGHVGAILTFLTDYPCFGGAADVYKICP